MDVTISRIVHFYDHTPVEGEAVPQAALVTFVHSAELVNLAVFDHAGGFHSRTSVRFAPSIEDADEHPGPVATWPPRV